MTGLAEQQAALVDALVAGGAIPPGFDAARVESARHALLRKRAGEVAGHWPVLLGDPATRERFVGWADGRPKTSSFEDGLAFARELHAHGALSRAAIAELHRNTSHRNTPRRWRRRR